MSVKELIEELEKIKDDSLEIYSCEYNFLVGINRVFVRNTYVVLLPEV